MPGQALDKAAGLSEICPGIRHVESFCAMGMAVFT